MSLQGLEVIITEVFNQAGLTDLSPEARSEYQEKFQELIEERIGLMALKELPDERIDEMLTILNNEGSSADTLTSFLRVHIEAFDQKVQDLILEFAREFIASAHPA